MIEETSDYTVESVYPPCDVETPYTMTIVDTSNVEPATSDGPPDQWWVSPIKQPERKKMTPADIRRAHHLLQLRQDVDATIHDIDSGTYVNIQDVIKTYVSDTDLKKALIPILQKLSADYSQELNDLGVNLSF